MKAVIRGNEKAVIRVFINKGTGWQYKVKPEESSGMTAAKIVDYINTGKGDDKTESFVLDLEGQLAQKTIEQLIFDTHQMEEILAEILESTDDKDAKEEIMFLQDLYDSKYPLTQDTDTNAIPSEERKNFNDMTTYHEVLIAYTVSGLIKIGKLNFSAKLEK